MRLGRPALAAAITVAAAVGFVTPVNASPGEARPGFVHFMQAKNAQPGGGASTSPNMTWHNGGILTSTAVTSIFWGTSWSSTSYQGDRVSGLDKFYSGIGGSKYAGTNTEYTGTNGQVTSAVTYGGHVFNNSSTPRRAPSTSTVQSIVAASISNPVANGYYPVYTDIKRGHAGYCAWHSWGTVGGVPVQFGFFFDLTGDPGCDPGDTSGLHSQNLAALANVSGHEISETMTDPRGAGWFDSSGAENGDKCAWTFNKLSTFGGTSWKIQGNWSNAANNTGSGYDHAGCIDGN